MKMSNALIRKCLNPSSYKFSSKLLHCTSYIHVCKRTESDLAQCIKNSIEYLRPKLKSGIPEIDVPAIEPLRIPEVVIARGDGPSHFKAFLHDVDVYGVSNFEITNLKVDVPKHTYKVNIRIPLLKLQGVYDVDARILVVPIKGKGNFYANATNCEGTGIIRAQLEDLNGKQYLKFTNLDLILDIKDYHVHLENLFEGDPILSQAANGVLNENRNEFIKLATPFIQNLTSGLLLDIANKITKNLEYNEIFPEARK